MPKSAEERVVASFVASRENSILLPFSHIRLPELPESKQKRL